MLSESLVPDEPLSPSSTPESQGAGPSQIVGEYHGDASWVIRFFVSSEMGAEPSGRGNSADGMPTEFEAAGGCQGSDGPVPGSAAASIGGGGKAGVGLVCARTGPVAKRVPIIKTQLRPERIGVDRGASPSDAGICGDSFSDRSDLAQPRPPRQLAGSGRRQQKPYARPHAAGAAARSATRRGPTKKRPGFQRSPAVRFTISLCEAY